MKRTWFFPALAALLAAAAVAGVRARADAGTIFVPDKGKFQVVVNGQPAGEEEFEINPSGGDWVARGTTEVKAPSAPVTRITATLRLAPDGTPQHYEWSSEGGVKSSAVVGFVNGTATIELRLEGKKPFTQQFFFTSPRVVVLDNNFYHQYAILARIYDWQKKGVQEFPVLIPQEMTPGKITAEDLGPQEAGGKKMELLRVKSEDLEINLYCDEGRLMRIVVPSANAEIARE